MVNVLLCAAVIALPQTPSRADLTPQRVLLNLAANPATEAVVTWRTNAPTPASGQIALASPDPRFTATARSVAAATTAVTQPQGGTVYYHTVRFVALEPKTEYAYRVGSAEGWSEWIHIRTASNRAEPFSFIYFGDAQNEIKSLWSRAIRKAFRELPYAHFMLHAGDLIDTANSDAQWGEWFEAGSFIHSSIPCLPTPGNHEYGRIAPGSNERALSIYWKPQFAMPENGVPGLERTNYYIDYQGTRLISLDSNTRQEDQARWLERVLANNPNRWTIATFHHPVYSTARGRDNARIRELWQPIFQKYNVALVLQGHDHTYGRRNVPTGLNTRDTRSGTVYVVSVSGPKMYRLDDSTKGTMPRRAEFTQLFQIVSVSPERVRLEAYTVTGELYDAFELTKNRDGSNRFRDLAPRTPEKIFPPDPARQGL